jgi:hypothetical protein
MFNPAYTRQVQLLLNVLPLIQRDECFALKGGTAINLFDIHLMFERFGLSDAIRSTVVVYLAGHARPIAELLAPNEQPIENLYATQFAGMSREPTSIEMLIQARRTGRSDSRGPRRT